MKDQTRCLYIFLPDSVFCTSCSPSSGHCVDWQVVLVDAGRGGLMACGVVAWWLLGWWWWWLGRRWPKTGRPAPAAHLVLARRWEPLLLHKYNALYIIQCIGYFAHSCTIFPCYLGMEIFNRCRDPMKNNKGCRIGQLSIGYWDCSTSTLYRILKLTLLHRPAIKRYLPVFLICWSLRTSFKFLA